MGIGCKAPSLGRSPTSRIVQVRFLTLGWSHPASSLGKVSSMAVVREQYMIPPVFARHPSPGKGCHGARHAVSRVLTAFYHHDLRGGRHMCTDVSIRTRRSGHVRGTRARRVASLGRTGSTRWEGDAEPHVRSKPRRSSVGGSLWRVRQLRS